MRRGGGEACATILVCVALLGLAGAQELQVERASRPGKAGAGQIVFSGTVQKIEYRPATSPDLDPTVRITFRVNQANVGVADGDFITIEEWAGLWRTRQRYRVGQRVALSVLAPSAQLGLSSPLEQRGFVVVSAGVPEGGGEGAPRPSRKPNPGRRKAEVY